MKKRSNAFYRLIYDVLDYSAEYLIQIAIKISYEHRREHAEAEINREVLKDIAMGKLEGEEARIAAYAAVY